MSKVTMLVGVEVTMLLFDFDSGHLNNAKSAAWSTSESRGRVVDVREGR